MATGNKHYTFDAATELKDAGVIASSAAAQVDSADKILDLGSGLVEAAVVVDVSEIEVATGNEKYELEFQLSSSATFASDVVCAQLLKLGDSTVNGSSADTAVGRYILPVRNEWNGTVYRYARMYTRIAGTIATGIGYTAWLTRD